MAVVAVKVTSVPAHTVLSMSLELIVTNGSTVVFTVTLWVFSVVQPSVVTA